LSRDGRWTKTPYQPNGRHASSTNSRTWCDFDAAIEAYSKGGKFDGVGYFLGDRTVGADFDKCRNPKTGELEEWVLTSVHEADTYTEVSPSGTGIKALARGVLPAGGRKKDRFEIYDQGRYFTVTGQHLEGTPTTINERTPQLAALHRRFFGTIKKENDNVPHASGNFDSRRDPRMGEVSGMVRHSHGHRCGVCGGHVDLPRHQGVRCYGFDAGDWCHCSRAEYAGRLRLNTASGTFAHRLEGPCPCGSLGHRGIRRDLDQEVTRPIPTTAERIEKACAIWEAARLMAGTLGEDYLRNRGITIKPPESLRYSTRLWHGRRELPAVVCRVDDVHGRLVGVHRIFITPDGRDRVDKWSLGPVRGGAVRLASAGRKLGLAEGIETALSVMVGMPELPMWAALSTSGLRTIELPPLPIAAEVIIFADRDPAGLEAAEVGGRRLVGEGRRVRIAKPPQGAKDFNDVIRGAG
jgi:hypothetical protein